MYGNDSKEYGSMTLEIECISQSWYWRKRL
jgi:hypothetical protein